MKVLLIDDERLAREELKSMLSEYDFVNIVGEAKNAQEGIQLLEELDVDLVFLDIQMPGIDGFEMLQRLEEMPKVIFVTAYNDYAMKAFEINALDYVLKPVDPARLKEAIEKAYEPEDDFETKLEINETRKQQVLSAGDKIYIKDGEKSWFIDVNQIRKFESDGNYVKVYFDTFRPLILRSLNSLESRLDPSIFFRANRKFIINLNYISHIENWFNGGLQVTLCKEDKVEISRRQAIKFKDQLSL